jgi:hypothetical protein
MNQNEELLEAIFKARSQELMELYNATKELPETNVIGILREELVKRFLSEFMPERLGIGSRGIISSADGSSSGEMDIVIYDKESLTLFKPLALWLGENLYPSEGVYLVIEVEKFLSSEKLRKKLDKLTKVKKLPREACYLDSGAVYTAYELYGKEWRIPPLLTMIFAYDGNDLKIIAEELERYIEENNLNPWEYVDLITILNKGTVAWSEDDDKIALTPTKDSKPLPISGEPYQNLAFAYMKITQLIGQLKLPPINTLNI